MRKSKHVTGTFWYFIFVLQLNEQLGNETAESGLLFVRKSVEEMFLEHWTNVMMS